MNNFTTKNSKDAGICTAGAPKTQESQPSNFAISASEKKAFSTLQAKFAQRGLTLDMLNDGSFIAGRWGLKQPLSDLHEVARFARQLGVC